MRALGNVARFLGAFGAAWLAFWSLLQGLDAVVFHGFAVMCGDGSPDFDPEVCGITWRPGLRYVFTGILGLTLLCLCVWQRWFTRTVLATAGICTVLIALYLLAVTTWVPVNPSYPEPPGPQYLSMAAGLVSVLMAFLPWRWPDRRRARVDVP